MTSPCSFELSFYLENIMGTANKLHYATLKSKRVGKSALPVERIALLEEHDVGYKISATIRVPIERNVYQTLYI